MGQDQVWKSEIVVTGMGMVTPVGHNAKETCASIRAGITRLLESQEFRVSDSKGHLIPVTCGTVAGVTDGHRRFLRLLRMALPACKEALEDSRLTKQEVQKAGLYLCLSEQDRPGMDNRAEQALAERIGRALDLVDISARTEVYLMGHAGVYRALQDAAKDLGSNKYQYAIVGAVDTYLDEITLAWLKHVGRLRSEEDTKGFVPSESGIFFTIETDNAAVNRKAQPLAKVQGPATTLESNTVYDEEPCKGVGLSTAIQRTLASLEDGGTQTGLIICDLNGERYRALEWGLAMPRALAENRLPVTVWHPADCIGDAGAASGALNLCLGVSALRCSYVNAANILIWGSSDYGDRGSAYIRAF